VSEENVTKELLEFENQIFPTRYKFGLLYVREGQTEENDFYANRMKCSLCVQLSIMICLMDLLIYWLVVIFFVSHVLRISGEISQDYQEFLDFLGPTVDMYQWSRFSGGLSVTSL
jgi:hypothetical protein